MNELDGFSLDILDCLNEDFQKIVQESDIEDLTKQLIPFLKGHYEAVVWLKDAVISGIKSEAIEQNEGIKLVSDHYILLTRIEDRILYVKEHIEIKEHGQL